MVVTKIGDIQMALKQIPQATWVQLTTSSRHGKLYHKDGSHNVYYVEAETMPKGFNAGIPVNNQTQRGDNKPYSMFAASNEFLWAYCIGGTAAITVTPADSENN